MEKKDFPKGTKPREIFEKTCERIAEQLIPVGYKCRKSKERHLQIRRASFVVLVGFCPLHPLWLHRFYCFFDASSPVIAQWRSEQERTEETCRRYAKEPPSPG